MKNIVFLLLSFLVLTACGNADEDLQKIDQKLHIYVQNAAGLDYLNSELADGYASIKMTDLGGDYTTQALTTFSVKKDSTNRYFIEYSAGAARNFVSEHGDTKIYVSDIDVSFYKKNIATPDFIDHYRIFYENKPSVFQVQKIEVNDQTVFTKQEGEPNIIKIVK